MIYILLPAYNEEESLDHILPKVATFMESNLKEGYHIIICNDGSKDKTLGKIEFYQEKMPIILINHKINRGLGEAVRDLFEKAAEISNDDDIIVRMDCDDTHEPKYIKGLVKKLREGHDVVIASRFVRGGGQKGLNLYRKTVSWGANKFMKLFFPIKGLREYSCGFRAYRASAIKKAINVFQNNFTQLKGLGFTCTLEKLVKLKILGAKFSEAPFVLRYNQKRSASKMVGSITTLGYLMMALLYHWPWGGWKSGYKKIKKLHRQEEYNA
jgi:dolichol-phosphate mannosyltransferase